MSMPIAKAGIRLHRDEPLGDQEGISRPMLLASDAGSYYGV